MVRIDSVSTLALAGTAALFALAGFSAPACAAGSLKAAYVEEVIPAKTWSGRMTVVNSAVAMGPGANGGILGVTSITLTNFDTSPQQVFLFSPVMSGSGCGVGSNVVGGGTPNMIVYVQPQSTLHLTYPTPLVFSPQSGNTCFAGEVTTVLHGGSVEIDVSGVIN